MKKLYVKSLIALAALCLGTTGAAAENQTSSAFVKMTYVDQSSPDSIVGEQDTIKVGYNSAAAVGSPIGFGRTAWGANWVGYLQVNASAVPGIIQKATLRAKVSGSQDSKRGTAWGVALVDNDWSAQLSYTATAEWAVTKLLNNGATVSNSQKAANVFEELTFDITDALTGGDFKGLATIAVYETAAAGGYLTEAEVDVEFEPYEDTSTVFDFEDGNNIFTDDSRITSAIEADATLNSNVLGWTCASNAQNGYSFSHYDFSSLLKQPALVVLNFDYYNTKGARAILNIGDGQVRGTTGGSSKVTYNKTGVIFQIGSDKNNAFINGITLPQDDTETTQTIMVEDTPVAINTITPGLCDKWLHVTVIANNDAKMVTWIVLGPDSTLVHYGSSPYFADDANACTQVDLFGYINSSHAAMIDNLAITNYKSNAVFADYSIKYVDAEGNEIKEARAGNGQVGKLVTLLDADKAAVYNADNTKKYIYDSDNSAETAIAESGTTITVKFRDAATYYAVLNCRIDGVAGTAGLLKQFRDDNTQWFFEGDNYSLYPSRAYAKDGKYYFTDATSWNGTTFSFPGSLIGNTNAGKTYYIGQLNYTAVDSVAYYANFEELALPTEDAGNGTGLGQLVGTVNSWYSFSGSYFDRFSGARGIRLDADSYVYTEPIAEAATYQVTIYGRNDKSEANENPYALGMRDTKGKVSMFDLEIPTWGSATTGTSIVENVGIPAGYSLVVKNTNADGLVSLDDISLTKVGDYEASPLAPVVVKIDSMTVGVNMTYVDQSFPDSIVGKQDTIKVGYNTAAAVGSPIGFGRTAWGANWVGYLQVNASAVPGIIQKATLRAKVSGSQDSKRGTAWGVALVDNDWSDQLNYTTTSTWNVTKLLNNGATVSNSQKAADVFEELSFDITEALTGGDFKGLATLAAFETAAAGGYLTDAEVDVVYEAFEATATTLDFEDEVNPFTDDSRIASAVENDTILNSKVIGWTCAGNAQNGYSFSHYDFTSLLNQPALVSLEFDYYNTKGGRAILNISDALVRGTTGGSSKVTYNKTGVIFQIGSDKNNAFINGITLKQDDVVTTTKVWNEEQNDSVEVTITEYGLCDKWLHVAVVVNNDSRMVNWVVTTQDGTLVHYGSSPFFADDANACTQVDLFGYINSSHCSMIDNLTITNYKSNAVFADYSIKYVDAEGNEIKEARAGNGQVGKFVTLLDADKAAVYNEDNTKKFIYDSDDSAETEIAEEGTTITVKFREAARYYAVLNCRIDGVTGAAGLLKQFRNDDTQWFFEGDNYTMYPSRAYGKDGKFYFTEATSWNGTTFSFPGSLSGATQAGKTYYIGQLNYTAVDSVAYYANFEELALPTTDEGNGTGLGQLIGTVNSWYSFSGGYFERFSGGRGIRLDGDSYVYTEPIAEGATYLVTIYGRNDQSAANENPYTLGMRDAEGNVTMFELTIPTWGSATTGTSIVEGVGIPAGYSLVVKNTNADGLVSLDDISMTKTGDYTPSPVNGINNVNADKAGNEAIYNLGGQRVAVPSKGIFIKGNKKIYVK